LISTTIFFVLSPIVLNTFKKPTWENVKNIE
jgi:hypothetical protein